MATNTAKNRLFQPFQTGSTGGSGNVSYNRGPIPSPIGGLAAGYEPSGTVQDTLDDLLYPYQQPSFTLFIIPGQPTVLEIGDEISAGTKTFTWTTANPNNINANSVRIIDYSTETILVANMADDGAENVELDQITKTVPGESHIWEIQAINSENSYFTRQYTVSWRSRLMAGTLTTGELAAWLYNLSQNGNLASLPIPNDFSTNEYQNGIDPYFVVNNLSTAKPNTTSFNCDGNRHIFYLWDTSLGTANFTSTGFAAPFTRVDISLTNEFGVDRPYYLYYSDNSFNSNAVPITVV